MNFKEYFAEAKLEQEKLDLYVGNVISALEKKYAPLTTVTQKEIDELSEGEVDDDFEDVAKAVVASLEKKGVKVTSEEE